MACRVAKQPEVVTVKCGLAMAVADGHSKVCFGKDVLGDPVTGAVLQASRCLKPRLRVAQPVA
jgi:hypothetical protein